MSTPDKGQSAAEDGFPRFAYLILSHKEPRQVEVLAARILELSPHGQVVVHHDLDSDDLPWGGRPPDRVNFVPRTRILWGDWSIVDATSRMVRFALEELHADWFVDPLGRTLAGGRPSDMGGSVGSFGRRCLRGRRSTAVPVAPRPG